MASSVANIEPVAAEVSVTDHELVVGLVDGRRIAVPLAGFLDCSMRQQSNDPISS